MSSLNKRLIERIAWGDDNNANIWQLEIAINKSIGTLQKCLNRSGESITGKPFGNSYKSLQALQVTIDKMKHLDLNERQLEMIDKAVENAFEMLEWLQGFHGFGAHNLPELNKKIDAINKFILPIKRQFRI